MNYTIYDYKGYRVEIDPLSGDERSGYEIEWRVRHMLDRSLIVGQGVFPRRLLPPEAAIQLGMRQAEECVDHHLKQ